MGYESTILADNPIAYYPMNESSGATAHDATSNHYDAKLSGGFTLGQPGAIANDPDTSILFDGLTGMMSLPYQLNYTMFTAISIEFWIKLATSWDYIVMTCDDTTTLLYDNASLISASTTASIEIASIFDFIGSYQNAYLAQFALYNYVLSLNQIQSHYNAGVESIAFNVLLPNKSFGATIPGTSFFVTTPLTAIPETIQNGAFNTAPSNTSFNANAPSTAFRETIPDHAFKSAIPDHAFNATVSTLP